MPNEDYWSTKCVCGAILVIKESTKNAIIAHQKSGNDEDIVEDEEGDEFFLLCEPPEVENGGCGFQVYYHVTIVSGLADAEPGSVAEASFDGEKEGIPAKYITSNSWVKGKIAQAVEGNSNKNKTEFTQVPDSGNYSNKWDFFGRDTRKFMEKLETGTVSLGEGELSKYQETFDSIFGDEDESKTIMWIEEFNPDITGEAFTENEAKTETKKFYEQAAPLPLEAFIALFVERLKNDPEIMDGQSHYSTTSKKKYCTSNIMMFFKVSFDTMYIGISGSSSDRYTRLNMRGKWYYEYIICTMKYCIESENELINKIACKDNVGLIQWRFRVELDTGSSPNLAGYASTRSDQKAMTTMVKEAGIHDYENATWENMFKIYITLNKNFIDNEQMDLWPAPMTPHRVPASNYRNIYDLFLASCKEWGFFE